MITNLGIGYNGRLGNQIFQFAACFGVAKLKDYDLVIPKSNTTPNHSKTMDGKQVVYRLDIADCFDIEHYIGDPVGIKHAARERHFHFDETMLRIPDNTTMDGYFQSEKYFEHCRKELVDTLRFKESVIDRALELLPKTEKVLVSIHVRRGDYTYPNPYHPVLELDYYEKSTALFSGDEFHFVVFSDDTDWCRETWEGEENFTIVENGDTFSDLCAMSMCKHNIIANSSFSWWASYLNKNEQKKVVAPSGWFGSGYSHYILDDLYTKEMILI